MPLSRASPPEQQEFLYVARAEVPAPAFGLPPALAPQCACALAIPAGAVLRVDGCRVAGQQAAPLAGKNRRAKLPDLRQTRLVRLPPHAWVRHVRVQGRVPPELRRGFRCESRGRNRTSDRAR